MHNFWWFLAGFLSFPILAVVLIAAAVAIDEWRYALRSRRLQAEFRALPPSERNYATHRWVGKRQCIPGEPDEYFQYCDACGCEDRGDPAEFEDLEYPPCDASFGGPGVVTSTSGWAPGKTLTTSCARTIASGAVGQGIQFGALPPVLCGSANGHGVCCELLAGHPGVHRQRDATRSCSWPKTPAELSAEQAAAGPGNPAGLARDTPDEAAA